MDGLGDGRTRWLRSNGLKHRRHRTVTKRPTLLSEAQDKPETGKHLGGGCGWRGDPGALGRPVVTFCVIFHSGNLLRMCARTRGSLGVSGWGNGHFNLFGDICFLLTVTQQTSVPHLFLHICGEEDGVRGRGRGDGSKQQQHPRTNFNSIVCEMDWLSHTLDVRCYPLHNPYPLSRPNLSLLPSPR